MPKITLKYKNKILPVRFKNMVLQAYPISVGKAITIGRNDSNDIVIDNMAVSGKHARIDSVAATFILTDLDSTNGTFVNDQLISTHGLKNNDVIVIGKHELIFDRSDFAQKPTDRDVGTLDDKTCLLDTTEYKELINQITEPNTSPKSPSRASSNEEGGFFSKLFKKRSTND